MIFLSHYMWAENNKNHVQQWPVSMSFKLEKDFATDRFNIDDIASIHSKKRRTIEKETISCRKMIPNLKRLANVENLLCGTIFAIE